MKIKYNKIKIILLLTLACMLFMPKAFSQADAGPDTTICGEGSVVIGGGDEDPDYCYSWSPQTGLSDPHILHPVASPTVTTTYVLTVVGPDFSFRDEDQVTVTVEEAEVTLTVENNITECMEGRSVTFTAEASDAFPAGLFNQLLFTFHYKDANGTDWTEEDWSWDRTEYSTVVAAQVPDGDADHKFTTPIFVDAENDNCSATSETLNIDVYELWIEYVRDNATKKDWKVVVGDAIEYSAIASSDCHDWEWDMPDGFPDTWNPAGGNAKNGNGMVIPYSDLSSANNSYFGMNYGTVTVTCIDGDGNNCTCSSTDLNPPQKASVFFTPELNRSGGATANDDPPCWYLFWKEGAVPNLNLFQYDNDNSYGWSSIGTFLWWNVQNLAVCRLAGGTHYPGGLMINGIEFGGAQGIDCCTEVVRHEMQHNVYALQIIGGTADTDTAGNPAGTVFIGDGLPDPLEAGLGCTIGNKDTYNLRVIKHPTYAEYGDNEYGVMTFARGALGVPASDWSKGGKQW